MAAIASSQIAMRVVAAKESNTVAPRAMCNFPAKKTAAAKPAFANRSQIASLKAVKKYNTALTASRRTVNVTAEVSEEMNNEWNKAAVADRLNHLEAQAIQSLKTACENFEHVTFPCALIAGDVVILELLNKAGLLTNGKCKIMFVDTFHLFPETIEFLAQKEKEYGFKAEVFQAEGCADKAEYDKKFGADLWKENIEEYDRLCKVEPFGRGLKTLNTQAMVNGRRRDHGAERAFIPVYEAFGGMAKINPLAYWTFEDCFDYLRANNIPYHPLHDQGYPSIGDAKDTVPVPEAEWFEYAGERKGRFTGLVNADGSKKTECGIHVEGAEKTFDRDLWEEGKSAVKEASEGDLSGSAEEDMLVTVYAPWCQFCQAMEGSLEEVATAGDFSVAKFRGDDKRDFVGSFGVESFPSIFFVPKGGKPVKYQGSEDERDAASLKKWVESQKVAA
mmetsp:Transcript_40151/g.48654  ORF Transcript_40151/g.48654 Transcript_40151/m.48654 type:complete len:447 (+) Transcript_40151:64-1404(+)|eukprot:CAMPEP_0197855536 /NCGR_PEP_ID=MMETSP1438-20131217/26810_1 /TAXON_ID=1461541 /ORGANISM="Pterosperma sp., Strain CCMP1384" /LENGTH=446 /DNA_ID=CAMNT_0043470685 /DNA_START=120 /DNA_END=1460 /DNA_ORIENTATION=+